MQEKRTEYVNDLLYFIVCETHSYKEADGN